MHEFRKKRNFRKVTYSGWALLLFALLAIFLVKGSVGVISKQIESGENLKKIEENLTSANLKKAELEKNIENLKTEEGQEKEIREKYDVKKPGEEIILIVEPKNVASQNATTSGVLGKIGKWFKNLFR